MRPRTARLRAATAAIALAINAGGCSANPAPAEPDPQPRYQQIPEDLCDRMRVEEVAKRFDLSMEPGYEPTSRYETRRSHWWESCQFRGWAEDGRFATEIEDFQPAGSVSVRVYHELADAQAAYDQDARTNFEFQVDRLPNATIAEVTGWWDSGRSLEAFEQLDPEKSSLDGIAVSSVAVEYAIRHENLVLGGYLTAGVPAEDADEAFALLHDLQRALIDEAIDHLTLTTE